ncbi:LysR family transcriptional regulator [Vibrio sp. RE88]|uniref:LysR family transcriptional regulator n=1 Tax=Vibrio sp. RE88 TaxID=2607610 RepID=UPI001493B25B|nr:LysR family transcriptional regulator [Vibrio sp. RE88]NOH63084.1 LysR family transcriptional regulator [Vibrio sp. RE88]
MNKNNINIMMLRTLVSLRETKSISVTAKQLNVTQSAISHAVRALESAVGVPMLIREPRGVELTEAGNSACDSAVIALKSIGDIQRLGKQALSGHIQIATVVSASRCVLPEVLKHVDRNYPDLDIELLIGTDTEVQEWVDSGIADIGVAYDLPEGEAIVADQYYAITGRYQSLPKRVPLSLLSGKDFVMSSSGCENAISRMFEEYEVKPNVKTSVSDMNALFAIVGAGFGVSIVPGLAFPENWQDIVQRQEFTPQSKCELSIQCSTKRNDKEIEVLSDLIKQQASRIPVR